jgi:hypothetical protein
MNVKNIILAIVAIVAFFGAIVVAVGSTPLEIRYQSKNGTMQQFR